MNSSSRSHSVSLASVQAAGPKACVAILPVKTRTSQEIEAAFASRKREKVDAVILAPDAICGTRIEMDLYRLRDEVVAIAVQLVRERPGLAAIVLECTTLPSFAADIESATGLPVFDYIAFVEFIHRSVLPRRYTGLV